MAAGPALLLLAALAFANVISADTHDDSSCKDAPYFGNCHLIVRFQYCTHTSYAKICCRSCTDADQLPQDGLHLDAAQQATASTASPQPSTPQVQVREPKVTSSEGGFATLRCIDTGSPQPNVTWKKDSVMIDGADGRHRILTNGSLQIIGLLRTDSGLYECIADDGVGPSKVFRLDVTDPVEQEAQVIGDANAEVVAVLGKPLTLRCYAYGHPAPYITWWRGERMLPLSSEQYEQRSDHSLHFFKVAISNLGPYTCQAYNGKGKVNQWTVTVRAVGRAESTEAEDSHYLQYLFSPPEHGVVVTEEPRSHIVADAWEPSLVPVSETTADTHDDSSCNDAPYFANCHLIVRAQYCTHTYYSKWCCRSCTDAGQLPQDGLRLDAAQQECANGGTAAGDACTCKPGFSGALCEQACGPDKFGKDCERSCSTLTGTRPRRGCSGVRFYEFGNSSGKSTCAAGLQGPRCDEVCDGTRYGADCSEACGRCGGEGHCDPYTGECYAGCLPGYHGANCKLAFTYLVAEPNVTRVTSDSVEGSVLLQGNTAGSGAVKFVEVQSRVPGGDWSTGAVAEVKDEASAVPFAVEGLPADSGVELRALLLDERMRGRANAPQVRLRTPQGILRDVVATEVDQGSVQVAWQQSDRSMPVVVEYQCEAMAGCPGRCGPSGAVQVAGKQAALLQGLQAAAQYRITVRAGRQAQSLTFHTALQAPNATVILAEVLTSNASAFAKWSSPDSCLQVGGPWHSYQWQLASTGNVRKSGSTTDAVLLLENLEPGTKYELKVAVANHLGPSSRWAAVNFTTQQNGPSAPQDLAAYRWNRTSLSLVWRAPARPNGRLRNYWVSVDGLPEQQVAADSKCAAWPDMVCHVVRLPRGKPASNMHSVVVAATNDKLERHGDEARIEVDVTNAKPDAVVDLEAHPTIDAVHLQWRLPRHLRGDLRLFVVEVTRLADGSSDESSPDPDPVTLLAREERPVYESVVRGLQANATYSATVRCDATGGSSHASVQFSTPSGLKAESSENSPARNDQEA